MEQLFGVICPHCFHSLTPPPLCIHLYLPPFPTQTFDTPLLFLCFSLFFIPLCSLQATTVRRKTDTAVHFQLDLQNSSKIKGQIAFVKSSHPERTNIGPLLGVLHPHTPSWPLTLNTLSLSSFCCSKVRLANTKT